MGIKLLEASQSLLYKAIRLRKDPPRRSRTHRNLDLIANTIEELNGEKPKEEAIWASTRRGTDIRKPIKTFIWKCIHEAHKVGRYWEHTDVADTYMPCSHCDVDVESMHHIMFECTATGQTTVWEEVDKLWQATGLDKPHISLALIMGVNLVTIRSEDGTAAPGATRLFRILVSEAAYLIWVLRCEWRIGKEADARMIPTAEHIRNRLLANINKRLRFDRILTNRRAYGKKALKPRLIEATWYPVLDEASRHSTLPDDWVKNKGVLVGIGRTRRPPGRNR
ncbi:hypothetical protein CC1G_08444 [Coprinopsis cinerea okayama7|uniref:Reverse transcriptase zinc-binding domain-containing protein n=1 Tax=Coprinopsis cinerea (strain Okayama-7 / 130 / ATCC MYA-4618 / FGSC 9003) TaxID=240176 RepID=A8NLY2_COPC7|nr:hypothetical protein CC1G_08444 [Coprinopsis cinerea okayama7\|eukprot:XP_001834799.2 hypothetical protein CC1G_08444 [Coprinopsis cinerea okayama7\